MLAAGLLNALTERTEINSYIRITGRSSEAILHNAHQTPRDLKITLSPLLGRLAAASLKGPGIEAPETTQPVDQIYRLAELRQAGALTDEEFTAAKAHPRLDLARKLRRQPLS
jgi:hypothetical protein